MEEVSVEVSVACNHGKFWREREVNYLCKNYDRLGVPDISKYLKRSNVSIMQKAQSLGLNAYAGENLYTSCVARCFNCDKRVVRRWIDKYELPSTSVQRGATLMSTINPVKFWKWADKHRAIIPWYKYELLSIIPEPVWVREEVYKSYKAKGNQHKSVTDLERYSVLFDYKRGKSLPELSLKYGRTVYAVKHIVNDKRTKELYNKA